MMAINVFKVIGATYIICSGMGRKKLYRKAASFISLHLMLLLEDVIKRQEFQRSYSPISARLILCLFCIKHIYYVRTLHFASFIYIFFWRNSGEKHVWYAIVHVLCLYIKVPVRLFSLCVPKVVLFFTQNVCTPDVERDEQT